MEHNVVELNSDPIWVRNPQFEKPCSLWSKAFFIYKTSALWALHRNRDHVMSFVSAHLPLMRKSPFAQKFVHCICNACFRKRFTYVPHSTQSPVFLLILIVRATFCKGDNGKANNQ